MGVAVSSAETLDGPCAPISYPILENKGIKMIYSSSRVDCCKELSYNSFGLDFSIFAHIWAIGAHVGIFGHFGPKIFSKVASKVYLPPSMNISILMFANKWGPYPHLKLPYRP